MQQMPRVRVIDASIPQHFFAPGPVQFLDLVHEHKSRASSGSTVRVALVDPFVQTVESMDLPLAFERRSDLLFRGHAKSVSVAPPGHVLKSAIGSRGATASAAVAEDMQTGMYVAIHASSYSGGIPKEPGFLLWGRPIVGRALVVRGLEVACPGINVHLLDAWVDVDSADYAGLQWLSVKDAIDMRKCVVSQSRVACNLTHAKSTRFGRSHFCMCVYVCKRRRMASSTCSEAERLQALSDEPLVMVDDGPVLKSDRRATCWGCDQRAHARFKCSGCMCAYYCSEACQRSHWPAHKAVCERVP